MLETAWGRCLSHLQQELPDQQFNTWIRPLQTDSDVNGGLVLVAPNRFVLDWVKSKFFVRINELLQQILGSNFVSLDIQVAPRSPAAFQAISRPESINNIEGMEDITTREKIGSTQYAGSTNIVRTQSGQGGLKVVPIIHEGNTDETETLGTLVSLVDEPFNNSSVNDQLKTDCVPVSELMPNNIISEQVATRPAMDVAQASAASLNTLHENKTANIGANIEGGIAHKSNVNPNFMFDNFIVGKSNQLGLAAATQVADNPGGSYNPLFIYGGVGLGKTHLMHAVGNSLIQRKPDAKVVYLHSERFVADMVKALQLNAINDFKRYYRSVDALLIDDIQFFAGKERSQEEFFHTFNTLLEGGQQIILTSDRYPKEINGLEERLKSRFGWGLTVAIEPPELETRVAILMKKAEQVQIHLPNDAAFFIAQRIRSNVRELEGALKRVIANAHFTGKEISVELVQESLKDLLALQDRLVSIDNIQRVVAEYYKIKISDLHAKRRSRSVARPRQVAMYLSKDLTNHSLPEIGEAFGGRDHTTVLHACRKIKELLESDSDIREDVKNLLRTLTT